VQSRKLVTLAAEALEEMKAREVRVIDVRRLTPVTDFMLIATGTSDRHVRAIAGNLIERAGAAGQKPLGTEGEEAGEWVLVDLQDVVVHIMLARVRDLYKLENLWEMQSGAATASEPAG
jgi:ribosome-associated protein